MRKILLAAVLLCLAPLTANAGEPLLENDVLPILTKHCLGCHGGLRQKGGLDLRTIPAMRKADYGVIGKILMPTKAF